MSTKSYKVVADNLAGFEQGSTVTARDLPGTNIDALVRAGVLAATSKPIKAASSAADDEQTEDTP